MIVVASPSASAPKVTLISFSVVTVVKRLFCGLNIFRLSAKALATSIIVSLVLKFPAVSLALAVKLITSPLVAFIVMFWENWAAAASFKEKL